jgi:hypothetical protein
MGPILGKEEEEEASVNRSDSFVIVAKVTYPGRPSTNVSDASVAKCVN